MDTPPSPIFLPVRACNDIQVAWQDVTWRLFNRSHIERGRPRLQRGDTTAALADFEAALTYPANLNVGRTNKPQEAPAQDWRGQVDRSRKNSYVPLRPIPW